MCPMRNVLWPTSSPPAKDYATSDVVRDRLVAAGVEVKDTPDGVTWSLKA